MTGPGGKLEAQFQQHKKPILIGGAAVAAALGYRSYKARQSGSSTGATPMTSGVSAGTVDPTTGAPIASYTGAASYDSTGTDVYNALQPQLAQQQNALAQLLAFLQGNSTQGTTTTTPTTPAKPTVPWPKPVPAKPVVTHPVPPVKATPIKNPIKGPVSKTPAPTHTYTVKKGDTLSGIAARMKVSGGWSALYAKNKTVIGRNPNLIMPGQVLHW